MEVETKWISAEYFITVEVLLNCADIYFINMAYYIVINKTSRIHLLLFQSLTISFSLFCLLNKCQKSVVSTPGEIKDSTRGKCYGQSLWSLPHEITITILIKSLNGGHYRKKKTMNSLESVKTGQTSFRHLWTFAEVEIQKRITELDETVKTEVVNVLTTTEIQVFQML